MGYNRSISSFEKKGSYCPLSISGVMSVYGRLKRGYCFEKGRCCHRVRGSDVKWCRERQLLWFLSLLQTCAELCTLMGQSAKCWHLLLLYLHVAFNQKCLSLDIFSPLILHIAKVPGPCSHLTSSVATEVFSKGFHIKMLLVFMTLDFLLENQRKQSILHTELGYICTLMSLSGISLQWRREIESQLQWNCCIVWLWTSATKTCSHYRIKAHGR